MTSDVSRCARTLAGRRHLYVLLRRRVMPPLQLRLYDQVAPWLARAEAKVKLPVGMSLFCVARVR